MAWSYSTPSYSRPGFMYDVVTNSPTTLNLRKPKMCTQKLFVSRAFAGKALTLSNFVVERNSKILLLLFVGNFSWGVNGYAKVGGNLRVCRYFKLNSQFVLTWSSTTCHRVSRLFKSGLPNLFFLILIRKIVWNSYISINKLAKFKFSNSTS